MPRAVTLLGMTMSLAAVACATTLSPGLANAPALATDRVVDASVHDAVANGRDSCGRALTAGPLRNQVPPCPNVELSTATPPLVSRQPNTNGIVMPWVEHYYLPVKASCSTATGPVESASLVGVTPLQPASLVGVTPRYAVLTRELSGRACGWSM